jgi:hypothetical protein
MVASALTALLLGFHVITVDLPIHFGWLFADYPDPERPGHLKDVIVSGPELLAKSALAVGALTAACLLWRLMKREEGALKAALTTQFSRTMVVAL